MLRQSPLPAAVYTTVRWPDSANATAVTSSGPTAALRVTPPFVLRSRTPPRTAKTTAAFRGCAATRVYTSGLASSAGQRTPPSMLFRSPRLVAA
jgi:hypothetical protein